MIQIKRGKGLRPQTNIDTLVLAEGNICEVLPASPSAIDYMARLRDESVARAINSRRDVYAPQKKYR